MGALAPVSPWLPEDDLLLKNSIENGASLESLAKGAVQFSQKFSVRELQDRWHSLLYDPVVSAEASFRMFEYERSALTLPKVFSRAGNSKEIKLSSGKRKAESVRSCYYALRKRIHNEPFNSIDLSFLNAPGNRNFYGNGDEPPSRNCMLGDPMANHFGLQDSNLDVMHRKFPDIPMDDDASCRDGPTLHSFHGGFDHPGEEDFSMQQGEMHEEIPHIFEENQSFRGNGARVVELGLPGQVPNLFEADHMEANPLSTYGQTNDDAGNICTLEGNQVFRSPIPDCGAPFQDLEFSSPLPEMPIWTTVEDSSSPTITVDDSFREKDLHSGDNYALPDDSGAKDKSAPGYDFVHGNSKLKMQMSCDELKNEASNTEGYLEELSNSLLNFTNDEEFLFMDVDGKEMIDKSYYDGLSLLLNSPNEAKHDHLPSPEPETSVTPDYLANASVENVQLPSPATVSDPQFPEQNDGIMICTLNTEDPEIPCNDDAFLPNNLLPSSVSIAKRQNFKDAGNPFSSSVKDFSGNQKVSDQVLMQGGSTQMVGSQVIPGSHKHHPVGDSGVKFELHSCNSSQLAAGTSCRDSIQNNSMNTSKDSLQCARLKQENKEIAMVKDLGHTLTDSSVKKPNFVSNGCKSHERNTNGVKQELDYPAITQESHALNVEVGSLHIPDAEPVMNPSTTEPEDPSVESDDDDVPYFSDIEAMILDMDLDPDDQDIYEQEVSKYQHEDTRRAIIRLEQGAHSYMQRAILSHGAFAILYGRHSKHYIKKPEVLLGRATEEVVVDIDLGREGRTNKISRRQAMINMDEAGSFHLKNLGKCPILVNNKEVPPRQSQGLGSSCLIEFPKATVEKATDGPRPKSQTQLELMPSISLKGVVVEQEVNVSVPLLVDKCKLFVTLSYNNFTSLQVPANMGLTSKLVALELSYNELGGFLPAYLASMPNLSALSLEHNKFIGMIPTQFALKVAAPGANTRRLRDYCGAVQRASETRFKPAKQQKKRSEVEPGVAGDHTPTLKSESGYLRLESLQALGNGGFEVEETLVFSGVAGKAGGPNCHNIKLLADSQA
ncbi:FHA domain-containing protein [Citrus sinensis]|nr:FHA domain-containing protein [Citrus sinensis]